MLISKSSAFIQLTLTHSRTKPIATKTALMTATMGQSEFFNKLPNEILLIIFKFSEKIDLKSIRACSKICCSLTTDLLFDRIYVSPHWKDLEVFTQITEHPSIRKSGRHLVYGMARFRQIDSYEDYCRHLLFQIDHDLDDGVGSLSGTDDSLYIDKSDEEAQAFLIAAREVKKEHGWIDYERFRKSSCITQNSS